MMPDVSDPLGQPDKVGFQRVVSVKVTEQGNASQQDAKQIGEAKPGGGDQMIVPFDAQWRKNLKGEPVRHGR
jgi:hypothetical protein